MEGNHPQHLQSRIKEFVEQLAADTEAAKSSQPLLDYLRFAGSFHDYSLHNCLLIFSQKSDATRVAGFHAWRKLGRSVKKGEKGIAILAPIFVKKKEDDDEGRVVRFRTAYVFDVSQTDGDPLPEAPFFTGVECGNDLTRAAVFFADGEGIQVTFDTIHSGAYGLSKGGKVIVDDSLTGADQFSVLVHELAHEMLHHGNGERLEKKTREIEAETVAHTVCRHFGLPTTAPAYLALYGADAKEITSRLSRLVSVVQRLVGGIEANLTTLNQAVNN